MIELHNGKFLISTKKNKLNIDFIHEYLCYRSYWAKGRSRIIVEKSVKNSICFGVYDHEQQVGFARLVTDSVTFAWLCDVFIAESYQGMGLGKWLIKSVISHPDMVKVKHIFLATTNAHELYRKYGGFEALSVPEKWMLRIK